MHRLNNAAGRESRARAEAYTVALFVTLIAFYGGLFSLWALGFQAAYETAVSFLGVPVWERPFFDIAGVLSWGDCHARGFDVFTYNPCDSLGRPFNYSPILLDLPVPWLGLRNTNAVGLTIDLIFLALLAFVLRPRTGCELAIAIAASCSSCVVFAVERANLDVFEFVLIAAAGFLPQAGLSGRLASYALYFLAGLLKFYPFVLLVAFVRERPRIFAGLSLLSAALLAVFVFRYWTGLWKLPALMPAFKYYELFGMRVLPLGGAEFLSLPPRLGWLILLVLCGLATAAAFRFAGQWRAPLASLDWDERCYHHFAAGALLIAGCFIAASNVSYRAIFLLLLLPGLFELEGRVLPDALRRQFSLMIAALLFCLWEPFFRNAIDVVLNLIDPVNPNAFLWDAPSILYFVTREFVWWWLATSLGALLILYISESATMKAAFRWAPAMVLRQHR